jgi:hypothetical protein
MLKATVVARPHPEGRPHVQVLRHRARSGRHHHGLETQNTRRDPRARSRPRTLTSLFKSCQNVREPRVEETTLDSRSAYSSSMVSMKEKAHGGLLLIGASTLFAVIGAGCAEPAPAPAPPLRVGYSGHNGNCDIGPDSKLTGMCRASSASPQPMCATHAPDPAESNHQCPAGTVSKEPRVMGCDSDGRALGARDFTCSWWGGPGDP